MRRGNHAGICGGFRVGIHPRRSECHSTMSLTLFRRATLADLLRKATIIEELAGRQGFEPRYRGPEPRVLPLDDLPVPVRRARWARTFDYKRSKAAPASARTGTGCIRSLTRNIVH